MQIRKVIFIVDKDRRYSFDVNQNITLKNLKKMIIAAANVGNIGLRIFQNGIEYTQQENETLDYLFPNLQTVEFTLSFAYNTIDDFNKLIKLRLNTQYCPYHKAKYPYFYCFTCGKSICSSCVMSSEHSGHNIKEKYDYLQSSRILVEKLFQDLKINIEGFNKVTIDELREKITVNLWPILNKLLDDIATKLSEIISNFVEKESINVESIRKNMVLLKKHCADGLDELKDQISIEDMMLDENIFLTFHKKFNEIANEKDKLRLDVEQYEMYQEQLKVINGAIEKVYNDIYNFLSALLNNDYYNNVVHEIERKIVCAPINRKEIFDKLLKGIRPRTKPYRSGKKKNDDDYENQLEIIENVYPGGDVDMRRNIPHRNTADQILFNVNQKYKNVGPTLLISPIKVSNPDGYVGTIIVNNPNLRGAPMRYKYEEDINLSLPEIKGNIETVFTKKTTFVEKNINIGHPINQNIVYESSNYQNNNNNAFVNENTGNQLRGGINEFTFNAAVNNANLNNNIHTNANEFKSGYQSSTYNSNYYDNTNQEYNMGYSSIHHTHNNINTYNNNANIQGGAYTSVGNGNIGYTQYLNNNNTQNNFNTGHFNLNPQEGITTTTTTIVNKQYSTSLDNNNLLNQNFVKEDNTGYQNESNKQYTFHSSIRNNNPILYQSNNTIVSAKENIFGIDEKYICQPIEGTDEILIYTVNIETITRKQVKFGTLTSKTFPEKCSWFNLDNKLYISGGYINNQMTEQFLRYDPIRNTIERLHDLPEKRQSHTMISDDNNNLYLVGGNTNIISKYNINEEKWTNLKGKLLITRFHPIVYIKNNFLYVFFGNNMFSNYVNSVEKGSLNGNSDFTIINRANYNLAYSTIIPGDKDSIFIIGGKGDVKESIKYNFSTNEFSSSPFTLSESASFHQTIMPKLGEGIFGYFSLDDGFSFIKLSFQ
jgi:hypothetical protein